MPWTVSQLVNQVDKRTERRASPKIDLRMEFFLALDEFVNDQHFWWRRKRAQFTAAIGTAAYDLAATGGTDANVQDLGQIDSMFLVNADGTISDDGEITPIFDPLAQAQAVLNTVQDTPSAAFIDTQTSLTTLRFQAPSSVAQKIFFFYFAVPMVTDTTQETIPLVPAHLHWGLIYALERRAYEFLYGQEDPRFVTANARYEEFLEAAANMPDWSAKKVIEAGANASSAPFVQAHS